MSCPQERMFYVTVQLMHVTENALFISMKFISLWLYIWSFRRVCKHSTQPSLAHVIAKGGQAGHLKEQNGVGWLSEKKSFFLFERLFT